MPPGTTSRRRHNPITQRRIKMPYGNGGYGRQGRRDESRGNDDRSRDTPRGREGARAKPKTVYALTEREVNTYWTRIGVAFVNQDGSITAKLDAFPVSGNLQIRDEEPRG